MATENTLILETTQGNVTIEMRPDLAPLHVEQIKGLVKKGFYDGIVFHRVIEGFMAQTGCPQGTGTGGSGKKIKYTVWGKVTDGMDNVDKIKRGEPVQNPDKIVKAHMAQDA
jgi:peptidylprolyl isomerase